MGRMYDNDDIPSPSRSYLVKNAKRDGFAQGFGFAILCLAIVLGAGGIYIGFFAHH